MTVIVGHRKGFMAADSLTLMNELWKTPVPTQKIYDFKHTLLAFAGDAGFRQWAEPRLKTKTASKLKESLIQLCQDNATASYQFLLVNNRSELLYGSAGFWKDVSDLEYYAIGSGGDIVQGFVGGVEAADKEITSDVFQAAIIHGAMFNNTINDVVNVAHISSWPRSKAGGKRAKAKGKRNASRSTKSKPKASKGKG